MTTIAHDLQPSFTISGIVRLASGIAIVVTLQIRRDRRLIPSTGKIGVANGNRGCGCNLMPFQIIGRAIVRVEISAKRRPL